MVYADPPWDYENDQCAAPTRGGITYDTMTMAELHAMPVGDIAAENSVLFMWATWPKLREALDLMLSWRFTYRTCAFVWNKTWPNGDAYMGLGHWTRSGTEFVLLGKRGHYTRVRNDIYQVVRAPVSKHSEKPAQVRDDIVRLCGDVPRVELFARQRVDGWVAWGNEVDGPAQKNISTGQLNLLGEAF